MKPAKFHVCLNVRDMDAAVAFLETVLATAVTERNAYYAKFDLDDPGVVLSLVPTDAAASAPLNHVGFRLPDGDAVAALAGRLQAAGIAFEREENVACCNSRQTKLWVHDPCGNLWELYSLVEGCDRDGRLPMAAPPTASMPAVAARAPWTHRLGAPVPERIAAADGSLDEVAFEGTLNAHASRGRESELIVEAARVLRAGGKLSLRGVAADRPLEGPPQLPGPAAVVEFVPTFSDVLAAVEAAGFEGVELVRFGEDYCLTHRGAELREFKIVAWRAADLPRERTAVAVYRGPFAEVRDDSGVVFRRGEPVAIDESVAERIKSSPAGDRFVLLNADADVEVSPAAIGRAQV